MPDPKLKAAMEEIKPILKKYDIAALVLLSSPTNIEYLHEFKTSWSCAWLEPGGLLRVRWKRAEFSDQASYERAIRDTVGTIAGFADAARSQAEQLTKLLIAIGQKVEFSHFTRNEDTTAGDQ